VVLWDSRMKITLFWHVALCRLTDVSVILTAFIIRAMGGPGDRDITSETSVNFQTAGHSVPEDCNLLLLILLLLIIIII
jgi:hypothetical protein